MRPLIIPFTIWLGVLQVPVAAEHGLAAIVATASALAGLTVLVYRLGVWRTEMQHTKHNVGAELARFREESRADFVRLERRFGAIDHFIAQATEQRVANERWQARVDARLASLDRQLAQVQERAQAA
jgi:hypothetical protein